MIEHGERAPAFELPAVVEGELDRVALEDVPGRDVLVLVFYPGDFNPACSDDTTDLDAFDALGLQADVTALAISSDSVFSHRAFADEYDLRLPLLADVHGTVAEAYGVPDADEAAGYRTRRAVVVVDHDGRVASTWAGDSIEDCPDADELRDLVSRAGDVIPTGSDAVDDEELEEITEELESQTEAAMGGQGVAAIDEDGTDDGTSTDADEWSTLDDTGGGDADAADIEGDLDPDDIELDLADPTEGNDEETDTDLDADDADAEADRDDTDDELDGDDTDESAGDTDADEDTDIGTGDHGVPDSL